MYTIYKYTSPSGKVYIGQTKRTQIERSGVGGIGYDGCPAFYNAILKYGWINFTYEILATVETKQEADEEEKKYIELYKSTDSNYGYNISQGGGGYSGARQQTVDRAQAISSLWEEGLSIGEIKEQLQLTRKEVITACHLNKINGEDRIKRSAGQYHVKKVVQKNLQGEVIKIFNSISEAEKETGVPHANIVHVCKGKRHTAGGFIWCYYCPGVGENDENDA